MIYRIRRCDQYPRQPRWLRNGKWCSTAALADTTDDYDLACLVRDNWSRRLGSHVNVQVVADLRFRPTGREALNQDNNKSLSKV